MSHTPWSQEDAEKWAEEWCDRPRCAQMNRNDKEWHRHKATFLAGLVKAAEMIEASKTIYSNAFEGTWYDDFDYGYDTHSAKLVGVRPIDSDESGG